MIPEVHESIARLEQQQGLLFSVVNNVESRPIPPVCVSPPTSIPVPPVSPSKSRKEVGFPLKEAKSLEGIISYLTRKHGGNVPDRGIVTITSKSLYFGDVRNLADFTACSSFQISLLSRVSRQRTSQVSGFAEISAKCASARLITQSEASG
jgi:hypothetical protein